MNEPQSQITKAIVFAYFAHQASPMERQQIEAWLKTEEGVEAYFSYLDEWERKFPQFQPNVGEARENFMTFIHHRADESTFPERDAGDVSPIYQLSGKSASVWLSFNSRLVAFASVVLLIGMWLSHDLWYYRTWSNQNHEVRIIRLEDGSEVELRGNSSLKHPRFGFGWGTRHVWLNGDAEFKVAYLAAARRFRVHTPDQTVIEVLGTVFVVNTRPKATRVMLKSGSIRLTNPIVYQPVTLKPGDLITISTEKKMQKEELGTQPDKVNWRNEQFEFHDTPLEEVARQLYDTFGVKIRITQKEVLDRKVSGTFQAETADDLLEAIAVMMNLEIEGTSEGYLIRQQRIE